jgi:hypothetical protein
MIYDAPSKMPTIGLQATLNKKQSKGITHNEKIFSINTHGNAFTLTRRLRRRRHIEHQNKQ